MAQQDIVVRMGMDSTEFHKKLGEAKAGAGGLAGVFGSIGGRLALGAAAAGLAALGEKMLDLRRKSEDLGVSIEFLQSFERMAVKFGGSAEKAGLAIQKLAEKIGLARTEGGAAEESFSRFGIELYESNGTAKSTEAILKSIADAYKGSSDAATKAALAVEFFGRTGRDINNILGEGAAGIDDYTKKMRALGLVASASDVKLLADTFEDAKVSATGLLTTVGALLFRLSSFSLQFSGAMSAGASPLDAAKQTLDYLLGRGGAGGTEAGTRDQDMALRNKKNAEEIARLMAARVGLTGDLLSDEGKLTTATAQQAEIRQRMNATAAGSVERVKIENELITKGNDIERLRLSIQKDQTAEAQKQIDVENRRRKLFEEVAEARAGKLFLSREELRGTNLETVNPAMRGQFGKQQQVEAQISSLEKLSEAHKRAGNFEYARRLNLFVERLLLQLSLVKEGERDPFAAQRKEMAGLDGRAPRAEGMAPVAGAVQNQLARNQAGPVAAPTVDMLSEVSEIKRLLKVGEARIKVFVDR